MGVDMLEKSVSTIAAICALVSVIECAADGEELGGLCLICGLAVVAAIAAMFIDFRMRLF